MSLRTVARAFGHPVAYDGSESKLDLAKLIVGDYEGANEAGEPSKLAADRDVRSAAASEVTGSPQHVMHESRESEVVEEAAEVADPLADDEPAESGRAKGRRQAKAAESE